jgi:hypothetical protein
MSDDNTFLGQPGSCFICRRGTDTAIGLRGEAEWIAVAMTKLGVPTTDEAVSAIGLATGCDPGKVPVGTFTMIVQVCSNCVTVADNGFPAPTLNTDGALIPTLGQRL